MPNEYKVMKMTYKTKNITDTGEIINQNKIDCEIKNIQNGEKFLNAIGYKKIMNIKENDIVYEKDGFKIAVKDIIDGDNLIEIETVEDNIELDTIEKYLRIFIKFIINNILNIQVNCCKAAMERKNKKKELASYII